MTPRRERVGRPWVALAAVLIAGAPADRVPKPVAERCVPFDPELAEDGMATPLGLGQDEVSLALNKVIQHALYCPQPAGLKEAHLTFELVVGCNGLVTSIETADAGGTPAEYAACVSSVIAKADFPAHDMADGMSVTYPVNVAW